MSPEAIDYSRYRVAESIAERYAAGETAFQIVWDMALDYKLDQYAIELILAAFDRKGKWEPQP